MYDAFDAMKSGTWLKSAQERVQDFGAARFSWKNENKALPVISFDVDGTPCLALLCQTCAKKDVKVTTINWETRACC